MTVHNTMEDLVFVEVISFFDELTKNPEPWFKCNCKQCQLDTACYVLNRVKPKYIKSGKGLAYFVKQEQKQKDQLIADISSLVVEGVKQVQENRRPHSEDDETIIKGPVFNFPAISGRILDGTNFKALSNVCISLTANGENVPQMNNLWENPYTISEQTPGTFTFWPKFIVSKDETTKKVFPFQIVVKHDDYEELKYSFQISLDSEETTQSLISLDKHYKIPNLFLFKKDK